jgi:hypothetical protein
MSLGLAIFLLGVLYLLVYHAGFPRFAMWSVAALVISVTTILCAMSFGEGAAAEIHYRQNGKGEILELSGLFNDSDCGSRTAVPLAGKVVKREFADDAVTVRSFVVEHSDGTRDIVNVEVPEDGNLQRLRRVSTAIMFLSALQFKT